jgi:ComF family protein
LPAEAQNLAKICLTCQKEKFYFRQARSAYLYEGVLKECLHLFKYSGMLHFKKFFVKLLFDYYLACSGRQEYEFITAIPLSPARFWQRQFNQSALIAKSLAGHLKMRFSFRHLYCQKNTSSQTALSRRERFKNVENAFLVKRMKTLWQARILLIDDVFTTGATASEASRVLLENGAAFVDVLTLARTT